MAVNAEKQGSTEEAGVLPTPDEQATVVVGGGGGSVALATTVQPRTGNLISLAAIPCLQTEDLDPRGGSHSQGTCASC